MANKKFSDFTQKTSTADVDFVVGYDGSDNVRISPSNLTADSLPLAGGLMTNDIDFDQSGTTRIGINFENGSFANNTLDDYEHGTFSPTFDIAGGTVTASYTNRRKAAYVKVGRKVTVWMEFETNSLSLTGGSGSAQITGLPFTVGAVDCCPIYIYPSGGTVTNLNYVNWNANSNISNATDVVPTAIPNTTYAELKYITHGNFYATMQSLTGTEAFRTHSSPTPAANAFAVTLTYYTTQ